MKDFHLRIFVSNTGMNLKAIFLKCVKAMSAVFIAS